MNTRILAVSIAAALAVPAMSMVAAADVPANETPAPADVQADAPAAPAPAQVKAAGGYLGVLLGPVPYVLRAQMGDLLPPGQGVMIRDVAAASPAAKAGLKTYDVVVGYNDQKLYSAEQLSHLVRAESPDTTVTLSVVHDGATRQTKVTLGQARAQAAAGESGQEPGCPEMGMPTHRHHAGPYSMPPSTEEGSWESFDSMSLKKLEDGSFKAEIQFLGKDGKLVKQEFTGTRDTIRDQVMGQKDLPRAERHQLLEALSARDYFMPPPEWFAPRFYPQEWFNWQPDF